MVAGPPAFVCRDVIDLAGIFGVAAPKGLARIGNSSTPERGETPTVPPLPTVCLRFDPDQLRHAAPFKYRKSRIGSCWRMYSGKTRESATRPADGAWLLILQQAAMRTAKVITSPTDAAEKTCA